MGRKECERTEGTVRKQYSQWIGDIDGVNAEGSAK